MTALKTKTMAKGQSPETRDVKQYKVYTLYANVVRVIGKKEGKEVTRTDRLAVAVFDNKPALEKYVKEEQSKLEGQESYEIGEDWIECTLEESGFDLPRNPVPNASVDAVKTKKTPKDNGTH